MSVWDFPVYVPVNALFLIFDQLQNKFLKRFYLVLTESENEYLLICYILLKSLHFNLKFWNRKTSLNPNKAGFLNVVFSTGRGSQVDLPFIFQEELI